MFLKETKPFQNGIPFILKLRASYLIKLHQNEYLIIFNFNIEDDICVLFKVVFQV